MEDLFDYLIPVAFVLYYLYRFFGGKKNEDETEAVAEPKQNRSRPEPARNRQEPKKNFQELIEEAARKAQGRTGATAPATPQRQARPQSRSLEKASTVAAQAAQSRRLQTAFATDEVRTPESEVRVAAEPTAVTDTTWQSAPDPYSFHYTIDEDRDTTFHTQGFHTNKTGFNTFHVAHGLLDTELSSIEEALEGNRSKKHTFFRNRDDIRRGIIMHEILGKPKALRNFQGR